MKYLLDRLTEKSTYVGLFTFASMFGIPMIPGLDMAVYNHVIPLLSFISGAFIAHKEK